MEREGNARGRVGKTQLYAVSELTRASPKNSGGKLSREKHALTLRQCEISAGTSQRAHIHTNARVSRREKEGDIYGREGGDHEAS